MRIDNILGIGYVELQDFMGSDLDIVNAARTSVLGESKGPEADKKLLDYLIKNKHETPLEMVEFKFRVHAPVVVWWQWVRHRMTSFNLQCLSGESWITFNKPSLTKQGRCTTGNKIQLKELYKKWHLRDKKHNQYRIENAPIRVLDESTGLFTDGKIGNVWKTGVKHGVKITTLDGYTITSSLDHKFLFEDGWKTLAEATGAKIENGQLTHGPLPLVSVNGVPLDTAILYANKDWLHYQYTIGKRKIEDIAKEANCSYHTIRKYLGIFGLTDATRGRFPTGQVPVNKGTKYSFNFTPEERAFWANKSSKQWEKIGKNKHPWYRGASGNRKNDIATFLNRVYGDTCYKYDNTCVICGEKSKSNHKLVMHHLIPIYDDPFLEFAYSRENIVPVHEDCHSKLHTSNSNVISLREKMVETGIIDSNKLKSNDYSPRKLKGLTTKLSRIVSMEYMGPEEMYDITIDGDNHNYVADGFVVHNSGRYTELPDDEVYRPAEWRVQSKSNKQGSAGVSNKSELMSTMYDMAVAQSYHNYHLALENGIAKEQARLFLLGFAVFYTGIVKCNARSLSNFLNLRLDTHAQYEIRVYADAIWKIFQDKLPWTAEIMQKYGKIVVPELDK